MTGVLMLLTALVLLAVGLPVAFTFGGIALVFGLATEGLSMFGMLPQRIWSIMGNRTLLAVPLFIYMGIVLQKSGMAERLLESMGRLFGPVRGGLAISTVLVGALLAASTGVVGASVVAMGVIALPVMLKYNYDQRLAAGVICASGTLGQIIPPSIVLIILGDVLQVPVGDLFGAAIVPGLVLVGAYVLYIAGWALLHPEAAPPIPRPADQSWPETLRQASVSIVAPLLLILMVLGSIFAGIATPTESAAVGCVGALVLVAIQGRFTRTLVWQAARETASITSMVFTILIGATIFSMVFTYTGGDTLAEELMTNLPGGQWGFLGASMLIIFVLGFFIDFIEIAFIFVPILVPAMQNLGIDPLWFGILVSLNLQTSFLTPPFGFSLFYLRGVAPDDLHTIDIYKGVIPFIAIQFAVVLLVMLFPKIFL